MPELKPEAKLSKEEFICLFLIYASHIDYEFSDTERNFILERYDEAVFNKMQKLFNEQTDYATLELILSHKEFYFNTTEQLNTLVENLHGIFEADGEYSRIERNFLPFFLKMIDLRNNESKSSK